MKEKCCKSKLNYRKTNLIKLDEYRRNGIYLGKNLIITYEAEGCYLNIREIRNMCQELLNVGSI